MTASAFAAVLSVGVAFGAAMVGAGWLFVELRRTIRRERERDARMDRELREMIEHG